MLIRLHWIDVQWIYCFCSFCSRNSIWDEKYGWISAALKFSHMYFDGNPNDYLLCDKNSQTLALWRVYLKIYDYLEQKKPKTHIKLIKRHRRTTNTKEKDQHVTL